MYIEWVKIVCIEWVRVICVCFTENCKHANTPLSDLSCSLSRALSLSAFLSFPLKLETRRTLRKYNWHHIFLRCNDTQHLQIAFTLLHKANWCVVKYTRRRTRIHWEHGPTTATIRHTVSPNRVHFTTRGNLVCSKMHET